MERDHYISEINAVYHAFSYRATELKERIDKLDKSYMPAYDYCFTAIVNNHIEKIIALIEIVCTKSNPEGFVDNVLHKAEIEGRIEELKMSIEKILPFEI